MSPSTRMQFSQVSTEDASFITVFAPGREPLPASHAHPNYDAIVKLTNELDAAQRAGEVLSEDQLDRLAGLFDIAQAAAEKFQRLSDRITTANGELYLDGDPINNALTGAILRALDQSVEDWTPLVRFFEKVLANPNDHSREQLYEWLDRYDFSLTSDGNIVGYKGVRVNTDEDGNKVYESIHSGPAIVDDVKVSGYVPNAPGSTIRMARSNVHHDPSVGCSTGLHVGTWDYAKGFAQGAILEVHVDPRDVVSVPTDCGWAKVRTCAYTVVKAVEVPHQSAVLDYDGFLRDEDENEDGEPSCPCGFSDDECESRDLCPGEDDDPDVW